MLCLFKTLVPLIVILQKALGNAGFSESGIKDTLKGMKVFKRGGTLDNSKKEMQIEVLSRRRMSIIHPANLKAALPNSPHQPILVPDHLVRKVLVKGVVDDAILMKSIVVEPCCECGLPVLMMLKSMP